MRAPGAPLRFLIAVLAGWTTVRAGWILSVRPEQSVRAALSPANAPAQASLATFLPRANGASPLFAESPRQRDPSLPLPLAGTSGASKGAKGYADGPVMAVLAGYADRALLPPAPVYSAPPHHTEAEATATGSGITPSRLTGSAWLFARMHGGGTALASSGQLGGSQAGARLRWRVNPENNIRTALSLRLSTPLRDTHGAEAAIGAEWHPLPGRPLWIAAERRVALGRAGRNAWSAYAAGGLWQPGLPLRLILDGYGQAGIVGASKRDLFADAAIRLSRPVLSEGGLRAGIGIWGAAQPGVARVDIGPSFSVPIKLGAQAFSLSADARLRVAGNAAPRSGLALTLGADF